MQVKLDDISEVDISKICIITSTGMRVLLKNHLPIILSGCLLWIENSVGKKIKIKRNGLYIFKKNILKGIYDI